MKTTYLMATLTDGRKVVSEFSKLGKIAAYVAQTFARMRPFNAWKVESTEHPVSGERVLFRSRELISGEYIVSITEVEPAEGHEEDHDYNAAFFKPVARMQKGEKGIWVAPENDTPEGAVALTEYPLHYDAANWQSYVILKAASEGVEELRYVVNDPNGIESGQPYAGDAISARTPIEGSEGGEGGEDGSGSWDDDN